MSKNMILIMPCFRYKYFSHLKSLKLSEEKQPLGRMLSVPSPLPSAEAASGIGKLKAFAHFATPYSMFLFQRSILCTNFSSNCF